MDDRHNQPEVIGGKLSVDIVGGEIVRDGPLPVTVSLTPEAALETGIDLLRAALEAGTGEVEALKDTASDRPAT